MHLTAGRGADTLGDLYRLDPANATWTALSYPSPPQPRGALGLAPAPGGGLFLFGGSSSSEGGLLQGPSLWSGP